METDAGHRRVDVLDWHDDAASAAHPARLLVTSFDDDEAIDSVTVVEVTRDADAERMVMRSLDGFTLEGPRAVREISIEAK